MDFALHVGVKSKECERVAWAMLRNGRPLLLDGSPRDAFVCLENTSLVNLWVWASREPGMQQHPVSGDTVLHLLCRTNKLEAQHKLEVLAELKRDFRNPFVPNFKGERAVDLTSDPVLKREMMCFMEFQPRRQVMQWFGPCFQKRVFGLLLVLTRMKVCKDVRVLLVKHLSRIEHTYVL
jgi:hypothetical protein